MRMNPASGRPERGGPVAGDLQGKVEGPVVRPQVRLVVGLGDPERAARLLPELCAAGDVALVEHCLTADRLLECVRAGRADAVLVAADLHRLGGERLEALARADAAVVVLAPDAGAPRWQAFRGPVLPVGAGHHLVREALTAALHGTPLPRGPAGAQGDVHQDWTATRGATDVQGARLSTVSDTLRTPEPPQGHAVEQHVAPAGTTTEPGVHGAAQLPGRTPAASADQAHPPGVEQTAQGLVLAVCSGHGSPGSTTVAVNLAVALGAAVPTILVDAALVGPGVAASLHLSRTRNLVMLAHDAPRTPEEWDRALRAETQSLTGRSPYGWALCGVPKPPLRAAISERFVAELLARIRERFRYVVFDLGDVADLEAADPLVAGAQRAVLAGADYVCLVARPDPVSVWRAQEARDVLWRHAAVAPEQTSLVLNHYDARRHHRRAEIEWALSIPAAAVVPHDHGRVQQALGALRPVVLDERSAAGRALLDFAERAFGGRLTLPPEESPEDARGATGAAGWPSHLRPEGWAVRCRHLLERLRSLLTAGGAADVARRTRRAADPPANGADATGSDRVAPGISVGPVPGASERSCVAMDKAGAGTPAEAGRSGR
jgi:Flp pilus assembly CpaE family ATPase